MKKLQFFIAELPVELKSSGKLKSFEARTTKHPAFDWMKEKSTI